MSVFSIAVMRMIVSLSFELGGIMYVLSTLSVGDNCVIKWSQNPKPWSWLQSFPEKAAIGNEDSITDPVKSTECSIW